MEDERSRDVGQAGEEESDGRKGWDYRGEERLRRLEGKVEQGLERTGDLGKL